MVFPFLTFLLILFPVISRQKTKGITPITDLQVPNKTSSFKPNNIFSNLLYLMTLFEYLFENNFGVHFFWSLGYISWIMSCFFWVLYMESFSLIFILASIILCLLGIYDTSKLNLDFFSNLRVKTLGFSVYVFIFAISILVMVAFNSIAAGISTNIVLLAITYNLRGTHKQKKGNQVPIIID